MDPHWHRPKALAEPPVSADAVRIQVAAVGGQRLQEAERALAQRRLCFNGDLELARQHLKETWGKLRQAQFRWKHRRGMERAALRVRAHELENSAQQVAAARAQLDQDQRTW